jgi:hypothetical protein
MKIIQKLLKFLNSSKGVKIKKGIIIVLSIPFYLFFMLKHQRCPSIRWFSTDVFIFYETFIRKEFSQIHKKNIL